MKNAAAFRPQTENPVNLVLWFLRRCSFGDFSPKGNKCNDLISEKWDSNKIVLHRFMQRSLALQWDSREDVVDTDDTVRPRGSAVVDDCGVALDPDPATVLGQETIILSGDLAFYQHWGRWKERRENRD